MPCTPVLLSCAGKTLSADERAFFCEVRPFGFFLFARNIETPDQVRALCADLRATVGQEDMPIFVDQEGGRVARLRPPHWPALPALRLIGEIFERDPAQGRAAAWEHGAVTAAMLRGVGIDGAAAPMIDVFFPETSDVIGDRSAGANPEMVAEIGRAVRDGILAGGVHAVIKHLPGHGRVKTDPHHALPFVDAPLAALAQKDFVPFMRLNDSPIGMTCHVVFRAIDPDRPVSLSARAHEEIIRGHIGFDGLLMSDDLAMGALSIPVEARARAALAAGSDLALYCSGVLEELQSFCADLPPISPKTLRRWDRALAAIGTRGGQC